MKRDENLDLIRSVAILLLVGLHFIAGTGWYMLPNLGPADLAVQGYRVLVNDCVPLFLLLTGYLCCRKELSASHYLGLVHIYVIYLLACLASLLMKAVFLHEAIDLRYALGAIANHYACDYSWYVSMYTGLFLLIPFLNALYARLDSRRNKRLLIGTLLFLSAGPSLLNGKWNLYFEWWTELYPLTYYFLGAYLREYRPRIPVGRGLAFLAAMLLLFGGWNFLRCRPGIFQWTDYTGFTGAACAMTAVPLFLLLQRVDMARWAALLRRGVHRVSLLSYGAYLFSFLSDAWVHRLLRARVPEPMMRFRYALPCVLLSLTLALAMSWAAEILAAPLEKGITACLRRGYRRLVKD
ncbi:MAG: acyltransferase family protein [Oscillospiraceae bacterium]|nr:acyltransferase family protein [Oscillospiraceae bacterium]